jgi:hypothetical protein
MKETGKVQGKQINWIDHNSTQQQQAIINNHNFQNKWDLLEQYMI